MVKNIKISDFDYTLPDSFIPRYPLPQRDRCRLLLADPQGRVYHKIFRDLPALLPPASLLVCNDTKVIRARLPFHKESGAALEIFLLEPFAPSDYALSFQSLSSCSWKCLVGNLKKWKEGPLVLSVPDPDGGDPTLLYARKGESLPEGGVIVEFSWQNPRISFSELIERAGTIPIPPYLNRDSEQSDIADYQTVYALTRGSVAAPTAGLHFTPEVIDDLRAHAVTLGSLTLHVGAGTFRPVKSEEIGGHDMHAERFSVSLSLLSDIIKWKREGRPVIAVGTTSVRTLESLPHMAFALMQGSDHPFSLSQWRAYDSSAGFDTLEALEFLSQWMRSHDLDTLSAATSIMIAPGFSWRIVDGMVTNFHQPKSTLLLLVSSFLGKNGDFTAWRKIYEEALRENYRFLSYGDASLLLR